MTDRLSRYTGSLEGNLAVNGAWLSSFTTYIHVPNQRTFTPSSLINTEENHLKAEKIWLTCTKPLNQILCLKLIGLKYTQVLSTQ